MALRERVSERASERARGTRREVGGGGRDLQKRTFMKIFLEGCLRIPEETWRKGQRASVWRGHTETVIWMGCFRGGEKKYQSICAYVMQSKKGSLQTIEVFLLLSLWCHCTLWAEPTGRAHLEEENFSFHFFQHINVDAEMTFLSTFKIKQ